MKLYIDHYSEIHKGKTMAFAVREGILRKHHRLIVKDLKFITRKGIEVILYHNIGKNTGNNTFLRENITSVLPENVEIQGFHPNKSLYEEILGVKQDVDKLILLENQYLIGEDGNKINTISTNKLKTALDENDIHGLGIGNINMRQDFMNICNAIEEGNIQRVHILPAGQKEAIKKELFSLEGTGTLIGNDFGKPQISTLSHGEEDLIVGILKSNKGNTYLKPRSKEYIATNISNFRMATIDEIPVGCVEIIDIDNETIELGALAVISSFLSLKIGYSLIQYVLDYAKENNKTIISLTNNEKLQGIYHKLGFEVDENGKYQERARKSPGVQLFVLDSAGSSVR